MYEDTENMMNSLKYCTVWVYTQKLPSRVTPHCATLIGNIFTNNTENNTVCRLLIKDISDHLLVFTVYDNNYKRKQLDVKQGYRRVSKL